MALSLHERYFLRTLHDLPDDGRLLARAPQRSHDRIGEGRTTDENKSDAEIEDAAHLGLGDVAEPLEPREDRRHLPGALAYFDAEAFRDHARDVLDHSAARDVGHRLDGLLDLVVAKHGL